MKLPDTKLNIGDSLWSISCNKLAEWIVTYIRCYVNKNGFYQISYGLRNSDSNTETDLQESSIGKTYFRSKKELMMNMFGECLTEGLVVK